MQRTARRVILSGRGKPNSDCQNDHPNPRTMPDPRDKPFRLRADQIRPIAIGHGGCIASDMITCGGRRVAFMYREAPDRDIDSGWRFLSGFESDEYMNDPDHHA